MTQIALWWQIDWLMFQISYIVNIRLNPSVQSNWRKFCVHIISISYLSCFSSPARWGLLDLLLVACLPPSSYLLLLARNNDHLRPVFTAGPLHDHICNVPCQTSTATIHAQCTCRTSTAPSLPCQTSITTIHPQCSLPDFNYDHPRPVFPAWPQPRVSTLSVPCLNAR